MEFVDNTGHIFSLPSFKDKPIGYEYEENDYVFWLNDNLKYRLSINNYYIKPIYFIYEIDDPKDLVINIYFNNSAVYKLLSPIAIQDKISKLDSLDDIVKFDSDSSIIKSSITEDDVYAVKIEEEFNNDTHRYSLFPIYVLGTTEEEGTWLSNLMIYIKDGSKETWCPITIGGMFVNEYEELIINGENMGISLPKDILKSIYSESIYNDEYNVELYNEKLKEYLINYMGIRGELGNYNSAINSLNWFGYGDKISISKLLKTDNDIQTQYIRNYFHLEDDVLKSFETFKLDSLISLMILINRELDETYPIDFEREFLMGENKPKLLDLLTYYEKIKIGNHDMEIEDDPEKYFYWKPYFDFAFNELGIKLSCLKYYYKKYFLPIHLNVHVASLGQRVFANDTKFSAYSNINISQPLVTNYGDDIDLEFTGNGVHYYTKQVHYIDDCFNEYSLNYMNEHPSCVFYKMDDTCINIPIKFKNSKLYNCVLLLERQNYENVRFVHYIETPINVTLDYDSFDKVFDFSYSSIKFIKDEEDVTKSLKYSYIYEGESLYSEYFDSYEKMIDYIKEVVLVQGYIFNNEDKHLSADIKIRVLTDIDRFDNILIDNVKSKSTPYLDNACDCLLEKHFSFYLKNHDDYLNFILYPKKINVKNLIESKYYEYWVNSNFILRLCVNNKWYEYEFKTMINQPVLDFGRLKYKYYLNNIKELIGNKTIEKDDLQHYLTFVSNKDISKLKNNYELSQIYIDHENYDFESLYDILGINGDYSLVVPIDETTNIYDTAIDYGNISLFSQISKLTDKISFNAYINDHSLIDVNHINYDIDFYKMIKYHLENNLHYLDGSLINNTFYRYIEYYAILKKNDKRVETYFNNPKNTLYGIECYHYEDDKYVKYFIKKNNDGYAIYNINDEFIKEWEGIDEYQLKYNVYIHNDLIGKDIVVLNTMLSNFSNNLLYAIEDKVYILREADKNSNVFVITNNEYAVIGSEDEEFNLLLEYKVFQYNKDNDTYIIDGVEHNIYDKLYQNENEVYKKYSYDPNIINNDKYLNNIYMFGLYDRKYKNTNILQFNKDIDVRVNGVNFKNIGRSKHEIDNPLVINKYIYNDEFEITGPLYHNIIDADTRYPDAYGLYWDHIFTDNHKYQYNFIDLLDIGYVSIIKNLDDDTYTDINMNNVICEDEQHIILENFLASPLVITYKHNTYTTYNDPQFTGAKYNLTIYDETKQNVLGTADCSVTNFDDSIISLHVNNSNIGYLNGSDIKIKTSYVEYNKKYKIYNNSLQALSPIIYTTVNDFIEVDYEHVNDLTIKLIINDEEYMFYKESENDSYYHYKVSDIYIKPVNIIEADAQKFTIENKERTTFIVEKVDDQYYQYIFKQGISYRKLLGESEGYYKYLYIQDEPYQYLNYSIYIKREYENGNTYNALIETDIDNEDIFTNKEYYYWEDKDNYTFLGTCEFNTLNDFYNGNFIEDSKSFKGELKLNDNTYEWIDTSLYKINTDDPNYIYKLSYKIYAIKNGNQEPLYIDSIMGDHYDSIKVEFYYNKIYLIRNKYYQLTDFIESEYVGGVRKPDGHYYVNDKVCYVEKDIIYTFTNNDTEYKIIKINNKFYDINDNILNVSINDSELTYIIDEGTDDEIIIQQSLDNINIDVKYYLIADDKKIEVMKVSNILRYVDYMGNDIKVQNPSGYWYDIDNNEIKKLDSSLNELKRYWFTENSDSSQGDTVEEIENSLNIYKEKLANSLTKGLNMDNSLELRYRYKNYMEKNLTGLKGKFEIDWDVEESEGSNNPKDLFNVCVCITDENDYVRIYSSKHKIFELTGNEKEVLVFFRLNTANTNIDMIDKFIAKPRIMSVYEVNERYKYNPKTSGNEFVVRIDNKEYKYGDNDSEEIVNLYKRFFEFKYSLFDVYVHERNFAVREYLCSIYEAKDNIKLIGKPKYDFYLMHDNEYWYGLYISRNTCDNILNKDIPMEESVKEVDNNFILKYERQAKQFLINRMYYVSTNGFNHFNGDDLICAKLTNNDRLPIRADITSKWNISGMSLGMDLKNEFNSNAETTIIGINKNDNKYQRGYYTITVRYSLDRDLQHQFKDTGTFRVD